MLSLILIHDILPAQEVLRAAWGNGEFEPLLDPASVSDIGFFSILPLLSQFRPSPIRYDVQDVHRW
jgi:hypothetical protein